MNGDPGALPSEGNPEPKSTPVSHGTSIEAHFDFLAIGVYKVDFAENKSYSSYFVLLPTELYDYRQVRVPRYLGKSVRELSVDTKQAPVSCLCSMLCGMRSGFVVFVPKISRSFGRQETRCGSLF